MTTTRAARFLLPAALLAAGAFLAGCETGTRTGGQITELEPDTSAAATVLLNASATGPRGGALASAVAPLLASPDVAVRGQAAQVLGAMAAAGDPALARPALAHADPLVRGLAQAAYEETAARAMGPVLVGTDVVEAPMAVLEALARMHDPAGLADLDALIAAHRGTLRAALDGPPTEAVLAADILARIGDVAARRWLVQVPKTEAHGLVLAKAARAALRIPTDLGATVLPAIWDRGVTARRGVMRALVVRSDPRLLDLVLDGLDAEDEAVRRNAIRALGNLGTAAPVDRLAAFLEKPEADGGATADVIRSLGAIGSTEAADLLRELIRQEPLPPDLLVETLLALGPKADRNDVAWVAPYLADATAEVRAAAARVLGWTGHPGAQPLLVEAKDDPEAVVRASVARALGQIGTALGAVHTKPMLDDRSPAVQATAAWALGRTRYEPAVPALAVLAQLPTGVADVTRFGVMSDAPALAATAALGEIGTPPARAALVALAGSDLWALRAAAAQALAAGETLPANEAEAVKAVLRALLDDPVNVVRGQALVSLVKLGETFPPGYFQTH